MVSLENIEDLLEEEDRIEKFNQIKRKDPFVDEQKREELISIKKSINYTANTLREEERYFDPIKASSIRLGQDSLDIIEFIDIERISKSFDKFLDYISEDEDNEEKLEKAADGIYGKIKHHVVKGKTPLNAVFGYSRNIDDIEDLEPTDGLAKWKKGCFENYEVIDEAFDSITENLDYFIISDMDSESMNNALESLDPIDHIEDEDLYLPEEPTEFGERFLKFLVDDYCQYVEENSSKENKDNTKSSKKKEEQNRSKYKETESFMDKEQIPNTFGRDERRMIVGGAQYIDENEELEIDNLRKIVMDVKSQVSDMEFEADTSFEGKSSEHFSNIYQGMKSIAKDEDGGISDEFTQLVGSGYGSRRKLNTILASMKYVESNAIYEKEVEKVF